MPTALVTFNYHTGEESSKPSPKLWIASLNLDLKAREIIQKGLWLDDLIIKAAQHLLHSQYPSIDGFHSTTEVSAGMADILRGGAIQILHVRSNHWVCLAVAEDRCGAKLFDSLYNTIPNSLIDMIIGLLHPEKDEITIENMKMQEQRGASDCGLFAIAVATSLCHGEDPTIIRWDQTRLRPHFMECLEAEWMRPFPRDRDEPEDKGQTKVVIKQPIHCICRQRRKNRERMMQCKNCMKFFHMKCLKLKTRVSNTWKCDTCSK